METIPRTAASPRVTKTWSVRAGFVVGFVQVIRIATDKTEAILEPCVSRASGLRIAAFYNDTCKSGFTAVLRTLPLASLLCDPAGKG